MTGLEVARLCGGYALARFRGGARRGEQGASEFLAVLIVCVIALMVGVIINASMQRAARDGGKQVEDRVAEFGN